MKKIIAFATVIACSYASAQTSPSKWYMGAEYGVAKVENTTQQTATTFVSQLGGSATATQDTTVGIGRIFAGYKLSPMIDLELGYFQSSDIKYRVNGVTSGSTAYAAAVDVDFKGLDYSLLFRPLANDKALKGLFIKVGAHTSEYDAKTSVSAGGVSVRGSVSEDGTGTLYGLGYDLDFAQNLFGRAAVTRYNKVAGVKDNDGTVYSLGIGYRF